MNALQTKNQVFESHARALLAALVGNVAATFFLADLEGNELVLHARHRRGKLIVKAWGPGGTFKVVLAKPVANASFVANAARCLAKLAAASRGAYRELLEREHARLESAMRDRLGRRDRERERVRAERSTPRPGFFRRLINLVIFF